MAKEHSKKKRRYVSNPHHPEHRAKSRQWSKLTHPELTEHTRPSGDPFKLLYAMLKILIKKRGLTPVGIGAACPSITTRRLQEWYAGRQDLNMKNLGELMRALHMVAIPVDQGDVPELLPLNFAEMLGGFE